MTKHKDILIVAATRKEIQPFLDDHRLLTENERVIECTFENLFVDILITGVGIAATTFYLTRQLLTCNYNVAINAGIAGSFCEEIKIGDVVFVSQDCFADLGVEYPDGFNTIFEEHLADGNERPFNDSKLLIESGKYSGLLKQMKGVNAITVNRVHGNEQTIQEVISKFSPEIETMEGAAFNFVCSMNGIPHIQLRSVSNKVEPRNREHWNIPLAINNLNIRLIEIIQEIHNQKL